MKTLSKKVTVILVFSLMTACSQTSTKSSGTSSLDPNTQALVSFKLTDAPNKDLKSVFVNIDHMEVVVAGKGKSGRLVLAEGLGVVDLLTLQNGVTMALHDIVAPQGISVQQIRLVLKEQGHYAVKTDDSICELKTPGADKTGVKIILTNKVEFEAGHEYSIVVDFDALNSVVVEGNGNCLLKPVLKLKSALKKRLHRDSDDDDNDKSESDKCLLAKSHSESKHESDANGDDKSKEDSDEDSNDIAINATPCPAPSGDPATNTGNSSSSTNTTSASTSTVGQELVVNPDQNNTTTTGGWDYTPVIDGVTPVISQSQLGTLL